MLQQQVAHLQGLVDRLMAERGTQPAASALPPATVPPPAATPTAPFQITGEDGREYVIVDGKLDTLESYTRAMSMLERQLAGRASYDVDKPDEDAAE